MQKGEGDGEFFFMSHRGNCDIPEPDAGNSVLIQVPEPGSGQKPHDVQDHGTCAEKNRENEIRSAFQMREKREKREKRFHLYY
jgi:hypothetical protein